MVNLRLMKYPGSKNVMIPDIREVFRRSERNTFVDVFGGSGVVSLNIPAGQNVYNDIDKELVNLFNIIKNRPDALYNILGDALSPGGVLHEQFKNIKSGPSRSGMHRGKSSDSEAMLKQVLAGKGRSDENRAFSTLLKFTLSFGGMGETYNTKEKSTYRYAMKTLDQFSHIEKAVSGWTIENIDFRKIFRKYDSENVFFYIDPPFYEKKWYNHNFELEDYQDLREILKKLKGKYLMNLNTEDIELADLFDEPDFIKSYDNKNQNSVTGSRPARLKSFYTNV